MAMIPFESGDTDAYRDAVGPQQVDSQVRMAMQICWMSLPTDQKTVDELEIQMRRIVERALKDLREDSKAFGIGE